MIEGKWERDWEFFKKWVDYGFIVIINNNKFRWVIIGCVVESGYRLYDVFFKSI